jgi:serine O-acetyltransferase
MVQGVDSDRVVRDENRDPEAASRQRMRSVVDEVLEDCRESSIDGEDNAPFPSRRKVVQVLEDVTCLVLPGRLKERTQRGDAGEYVDCLISKVFDTLSVQISVSLRHGCMKSGDPCERCAAWGREQALLFLERFSTLREVLATDVQAAYDRDPAASGLEEVVLSYPGLTAITAYRVAHELWLLEVPFIPRMMTEYAHSQTGIDIHPGAQIGSALFIDHGTGVVIGETTEIGHNVTIYQGVTLGGYRFKKDAEGNLLRGYKRHPTVGDDVTIYAGATILGGDTVVGARTVIGGSVWLTHSVPADAVVTMPEPDLRYKVGY